MADITLGDVYDRLNPEYEIVSLEQTNSGIIADGADDSVEFDAPAGYIYELLYWQFKASISTSGAAGTHQVLIRTQPEITYAQSTPTFYFKIGGATTIDISSNGAQSGSTEQYPTSEIGWINQALPKYTNQINFIYTNNSTVSTTETTDERKYVACCRKIKVRT